MGSDPWWMAVHWHSLSWWGRTHIYKHLDRDWVWSQNGIIMIDLNVFCARFTAHIEQYIFFTSHVKIDQCDYVNGLLSSTPHKTWQKNEQWMKNTCWVSERMSWAISFTLKHSRSFLHTVPGGWGGEEKQGHTDSSPTFYQSSHTTCHNCHWEAAETTSIIKEIGSTTEWKLSFVKKPLNYLYNTFGSFA